MTQKTHPSAIVFMLLSALFASFGQIFFKFAANNLTDINSLIFNSNLYFGGICYLAGMILMLKALRRGELSVVYPVLATSFVWVSILSPIFFKNDVMTLQKWIGVGVVILGITLVGRGRTK